MKLYRYITRRFATNLVKVQAILLGVILLFDSVDLIQRFGRTAGFKGVMELSIVRAPAIVSTTFPLVILIASLWTYLALARSSELVVARASGVSGLKTVVGPLLLSCVLGVFAFSVMNPIVAATRQRETLMVAEISNPENPRLSLSGKDIWLRQSGQDGQMVVQADRAAPDGSSLYGVRMFKFGEAGQIEIVYAAPVASLQTGAWHLREARRWLLTGQVSPEPDFLPELKVPTNLTSDQLLNSFARPESVPFWELPRFIGRMEDSGFSAIKHRMFFQTELARPLVFSAMVLIGCAFSMRPTRFGNTSTLVLGAVVAGFSFYFVLDLAASFGAARQMPVAIAAWAPPIAAIMLAFALFLHFEDG